VSAPRSYAKFEADGSWTEPPQWGWFCEALLRLYGERGELSDEVLTEAVAQSFKLVRPDAQLRKAKSLLKKPTIQSRLGAIFELAGIDLIEVLKVHADMIREKHWPAIAAYEKLVLPEPAKRIEIDQRTIHATYKRPEDTTPPPMEPRALSAKVER
jgi:hypothetical protein